MVWRQGKEREGEGRRRQAEPASARPPAAAAARPDAGGGSGHRRQRGEVGKRWRGVAPESRVEESNWIHSATSQDSYKAMLGNHNW